MDFLNQCDLIKLVLNMLQVINCSQGIVQSNSYLASYQRSYEQGDFSSSEKLDLKNFYWLVQDTQLDVNEELYSKIKRSVYKGIYWS